MITEITLHDFILQRIYITLYNKVAIRRDAYIACESLDQFHRFTAQESRQKILIHIIGHGGSRRVGICRISAQTYYYRHTLPQASIPIIMPCTCLMFMPMHTRSLLVEALHAVHSHITHTRIRIKRIYHRQSNKSSAITLPRMQKR